MIGCVLCDQPILHYIESIGELASSPISGHDLHVHNMQIWLAVSHNAQPRTNNYILQMTWLLIAVGVYNIYCINIECPIIRGVYWSPESMTNLPQVACSHLGEPQQRLCLWPDTWPTLHMSWQSGCAWINPTGNHLSWGSLGNCV